MRVVLTGGHLSPAFSVVEKLKREDVLYVGRKHALKGDNALSLEYQLCKNMGISFASVKTAKLQRKSLKNTLLSFSNLPLGTIQAMVILRKFKPSVVLGFGGYISLPVIFAAKFLKIPIVIHEQTLDAGIANKTAAKLADKICISWPSSEKYFPKEKIVITGNPIRSDILKDNNESNVFNFKNNLPTVYITGGSLGSHIINVLTEKILPSLLKIANVIHQTGNVEKYLDFDRLSKKEYSNYIVKDFFLEKELAGIYKKANLVISRSGINTITELIYFQKPALLIPLQTGQKNEQLKNAQFYKNLGLAKICMQNDLSPEKLFNLIKEMLSNVSLYKENAKTKEILKKNAAERIIGVLEDVSK